jgi:hypothetical protein
MALLVTGVLLLFAVVLFLMAGAVLEMHRGLTQVRQQSGVIDSPVALDVDLPRRLPADDILPPELLGRDRALILILSDHCSTCSTIAEHLNGTVPDGAWILLAPQTPESGRDWLARHSLGAEPGTVIRDDRGRLTRGLGVNISPAVLRVRKGQAVAAHTLPSARRLDDELAWLNDLVRVPEMGELEASS